MQDLSAEQESGNRLFLVRVRGNFYGGKYYEDGVDSIFVLASSPDEAVKIAKDNVNSVEQHFRTKRVHGGKLAIAAKDQKHFTPENVFGAKVTTMTTHSKVLHKNAEVKPASVK